jgi:hypothetical protein
MNLKCHLELTWIDAGQEIPREHVLLFFVTAADPDIVFSGCYIDGKFHLLGQEFSIPVLAGTKVARFAYVGEDILPKNCKEVDNGWVSVDDSVPDDDEPVAIWPEVRGHRFAAWNPYDDCWDTEDGDDYLCDKHDVKKWYAINWGGAC